MSQGAIALVLEQGGIAGSVEFGEQQSRAFQNSAFGLRYWHDSNRFSQNAAGI